MERNKYGINFDEGLPFESDWEFENLYVSINENQLAEFSSWLKNDNTPILIGGQIGSGKSTFLNIAFKETGINPDIIFHFDKDSENLSEGDFLKTILLGVSKYAMSKGVDLTFSKLPEELTNNEILEWNTFIDKLSTNELSLEVFEFRKILTQKLFENFEYVLMVLNQILSNIKIITRKELLFFASGIDKYAPFSTGLFALQSSLKFLSIHKTIFEVNAVHLFDNKWILKNTQKIFLGTFTEVKIIELLKKRKGKYVNTNTEIVKNIAYFSGGNPRQALRLLVNYEFYKNKKNSAIKSMRLGLNKTIQDFFAYADEPSKELIRFVDTKKSLSATLLNLPGDKDTAQKAIYGNWVLIGNKKEGNIWNAKVNPIISLFFSADIQPEEYEMSLLKLYAENEQMSNSGMTYSVSDDASLGKYKLGLSKIAIENFKLNLTDTLDLLSASFMSNNRQDRIIIAYKNKEIMEAVKAYIFSKVSVYDDITIKDSYLIKNENLVYQLNKIIFSNEYSVYSVVFGDDFSDEQIIEVDKIRDKLLYKQILWWISIDHISRYLQKWTQLRQLFQIVILEDEIMNVLTIKQIEEDIEFYNSVDFKDSITKNLQIVLEYLKVHGGK